MIEITHIMWGEKKIGIALHKMKSGDNDIKITEKDSKGNPYYPHPFVINKEQAISQYGINPIQKNGLPGIWVFIRDIVFNERRVENVTTTKA